MADIFEMPGVITPSTLSKFQEYVRVRRELSGDDYYLGHGANIVLWRGEDRKKVVARWLPKGKSWVLEKPWYSKILDFFVPLFSFLARK